MKYNYFLGLTIIVCIYVSYVNVQKFKASASTNDLARAINEYVNKSQNDNSFTADGENNSTSSGKNSREIAKVLDDSSVIKTIYDGVGNKKESRCFSNHPRVVCVVLRSMVDGQRLIQVYGQNGYIKELEPSMFDRVMTSTADEIADLADIYVNSAQTVQTAHTVKAPATTYPTPTILSGESQISTKTLPAEQLKTEEAKKTELTTGGSAIKSSPAAENTKSKENENPSRQPVEEK